jgi:hypothetical protein
VAFPYAGYISIRSGWESDDNYLLFDAGPVGYRHAHQDKLEVILWAYGREILYDPGRENYDPDNPYQQYCLDTFSHSTGLVDNRPQRRRWYFDPSPLRNYPYGLAPDFKYDIQGSAVWASGAYTDSYGKAGSIGNHAYPYTDNSNFYEGWGTPAKHYRQVAYAAPDIFIVQDRFVPENTALHAYEIRWQLDSLAVTVNGADAETGDAGKPNLAIIPLRPSGIQVEAVSAQDTPEIMGWKVLEKSYPATTLRHLTSGTGPQGFLTLLYPLKPGETAGDMRISEQDGEMILDTDDGRRFLIHPAANSNDRLTLTDSGYTDSDGDELPDWWELRYFGGRTNARPETVCANGINTIHDAYVAGLDPNDPNDRFEVRAHRRDDETVISWPAVSGRVYTVCWTTNLLTGFHETNVSWPDREFTNRLSDHTGFYWLKVRREDSR